MDWIEFIGHVGAFLTSVTFVPQVYKVWKSRSANDLSLAMMLIVVTSTITWLIYAIALVLWPVILANGIVLSLSLILIYFKLTFKKSIPEKTPAE